MTAAKISSALLLALCATAARADWEGDVEMKMSDRPGRGGPEAMPPGGGKIRFKEGKLRMDVQMGPMSMTTLVDFAARKVFIINDGARQYVEHDTEASRAGQDGMPHCKTQNFIECMKEQGFKKVGSG